MVSQQQNANISETIPLQDSELDQMLDSIKLPENSMEVDGDTDFLKMTKEYLESQESYVKHARSE